MPQGDRRCSEAGEAGPFCVSNASTELSVLPLPPMSFDLIIELRRLTCSLWTTEFSGDRAMLHHPAWATWLPMVGQQKGITSRDIMAWSFPSFISSGYRGRFLGTWRFMACSLQNHLCGKQHHFLYIQDGINLPETIMLLLEGRESNKYCWIMSQNSSWCYCAILVSKSCTQSCLNL